MVYNVVINRLVAEDRDKLVESLYTFLNRYVPTRLIYENEEDRADCTQDTIMFMLRRYDELAKELNETDPEWRDKFNYEKYFYNRARSYISFWIRKLKNDRNNRRKYIENAIYLRQYVHEDYIKPIDLKVIKKITKEYNFEELDTKYLKDYSIRLLEQIGYSNTTEKVYNEAKQFDSNRKEVLDKIAYTVVDEYLVITLGENK